MSRAKRTTGPATAKRPTKPNWRNNDDARYHGYPSWPSPESLHPGPRVTLAFVAGDEESQAIVDAYAFRFPVTVVSEVLQ